MRTTILAAALCLLCPLGVAAQDGDAEAADEGPRPRYLDAIEAELEALRIPAACEAESATRARCSYTVQGGGRELSVHLIYSDETDTIYYYVDRYLVAPPGAESTMPLLRRLMELNWQMLVGKFEWDPSDGTVRLAFVQNTDSNFDRRSFRSLIRTIGPLAQRYLPELTRLAGD